MTRQLEATSLSPPPLSALSKPLTTTSETLNHNAIIESSHLKERWRPSEESGESNNTAMEDNGDTVASKLTKRFLCENEMSNCTQGMMCPGLNKCIDLNHGTVSVRDSGVRSRSS
jgi:hypothetical protein